ncbi:MAG: hypothetical protein JSR44_10405 [Spirochaetes bacterium]|nr:hypothetical protein [Spirochaetota bacterium]
MQIILTTSVSLPAEIAAHWRIRQREIMRYTCRYLRIQMRKQVRRSVTRKYNRQGGTFDRVTTRFTDAEYDTLHGVAAALRVSVSSLIYGLIKLWLKPSRRAIRRFFLSNYQLVDGKWDPEAGFIEEIITFWRVEHPEAPPPWLGAPELQAD